MTKRPAREGAPARIARILARDPLLAPLGETARSRGWRVELVGGWVRDAIGRRDPRDVDLSTADPEPLLSWLAERSAHRGVTFEQRVVNHRFTIDGRTVDVVERAERTVEEELARRDFTVNAMAVDLASGRFLDPCGGLDDLEAGRLRLPRADAFETDPIRMLRGVRLSAEIPGLALDEAAQSAAIAEAASLERAAVERSREEIDRMLATSRASAAVAESDRLGLLSVVLPEIEVAKGVTQNRYHHLDVWEHTLAALAGADHPRRLARGLLSDPWPCVSPSEEDPPRPPAEEAPLLLRWALLMHDLGKPASRAVREDGAITFHGHEAIGEEIADEACARLKMSSARRRAIAKLVKLHLRLVVPPRENLGDRALTRIVKGAGPLTEILGLHALADQGATRGPGWRRLRSRLRETVTRLFEVEREVHRRAARGRLLSGRDVIDGLGLPPGREVGRLLARAEELRDEGVLSSREEALAWLETQRER